MSRRESESRTGGPEERPGRLRAYLSRFFTSWVAEDPDPTYSSLDRSDGLGQVPDPVCEPRVQLPESPEVAQHVRSDDRTDASVTDRTDSPVAGRSDRAVAGRSRR
jgi:hypothetical protein